MSLAKLTSLSTQTLSLLLERQRLATLPPFGTQSTTTTSSNLHIPQITRNMKQLRKGILDLETKEGRSQAVTLLRSQYDRMRGMLGEDADFVGIEGFAEDKPLVPVPAPVAVAEGNLIEAKDVVVAAGGEEGHLAASSPSGSKSASGSSTPHGEPGEYFARDRRSPSSEPVYTPYTDDPEAGTHPSILLQEQRRLMGDQDERLVGLSHSVNRQRDMSLQINDELGVHTGILQELDHDLNGTESRLLHARQRLGRVAKGAREHG
ncbi:hypothetical protein EVG20_g8984 [Dentipellis fragilis]|uniref:t-SNARE coiled-coil homology domain-containing protein n=1 Tax=Dentipellis fragilis TaxID=205917 RepID=A0A4Y9Y1Q4_9AGAM|nr:hypothetical protein EVG20_g8984 [Dentipellis fragilis]